MTDYYKSIDIFPAPPEDLIPYVYRKMKKDGQPERDWILNENIDKNSQIVKRYTEWHNDFINEDYYWEVCEWKYYGVPKEEIEKRNIRNIYEDILEDRGNAMINNIDYHYLEQRFGANFYCDYVTGTLTYLPIFEHEFNYRFDESIMNFIKTDDSEKINLSKNDLLYYQKIFEQMHSNWIKEYISENNCELSKEVIREMDYKSCLEGYGDIPYFKENLTKDNCMTFVYEYIKNKINEYLLSA